jgi:hypothetical protein
LGIRNSLRGYREKTGLCVHQSDTMARFDDMYTTEVAVVPAH